MCDMNRDKKQNVVKNESAAYVLVKRLIKLHDAGVRRVTIGYLLDTCLTPCYTLQRAASATMFERLVYELADVRNIKYCKDKSVYYYTPRWRAFCGHALSHDTQKRKKHTEIEVNINAHVLRALRDQWSQLNASNALTHARVPHHASERIAQNAYDEALFIWP